MCPTKVEENSKVTTTFGRCIMSREKDIEELLYVAHKEGIHSEVMNLARELQDTKEYKYNRVEAYTIAYKTISSKG